MANKTWTRQEEEIVKGERQRGTEVAGIAAILGRSAASVSGKLRDLKERGELIWTDRQGNEINPAESREQIRKASHEFENVALKA